MYINRYKCIYISGKGADLHVYLKAVERQGQEVPVIYVCTQQGKDIKVEPYLQTT